MTETRKKQFETAVRQKRLKFENGKWWALCATCTGRRDENVYWPVQKHKMRSIEDCCMDVLQNSGVTCKHNTKEKAL